ncbi:GAF domain-containing protein [Phytophthora infestans]|uniref:GAF domain-containing protein n=1 Tax=Phytophthora infestans TaxID=4787 RepID=A0A833TDA7_PHYIN|nr:GAF domain-containing protein [Phytophthora infestans]
MESDLSLRDALSQVATDVLGSIPAQRCIVYIYDKPANLLRPQIVVNYHEKVIPAQPKDQLTEDGSEPQISSSEQPSEASKSSSSAFRKENVTASPLASFPPVMGMVSSCFLQRRCLRMEEANPRRAFHRDYDVPKDMQVDSILCAPVIMHRRAAAVIQLLNRLDTTERVATPQDIKDEFSTEVRLQRLKSVNAMVETGFSTKDEQKLMHFTIHIAQTIDTNTKKLASVRSHAKIREEKAKQAMDLMNALNGTTTAHTGSIGAEMVLPTDVAEFTDHYMRRATITRLPTQTGATKDMLGVLVVVMRLQAMFRGRRQRRAEKFAEELEKFKRQRERMKSMITMQRMVRTPEESKPRGNEKGPSSHLKDTTIHSKEDSTHSKERDDSVEELKKRPPSQPRPSVSYSLSTPVSPRPPQQPETPPRNVSTPQTTHLLRRTTSAMIQKGFRRHQQQRQAITPATVVHVKPVQVSKQVASAVKVQSFIRGTLVRKKIRKALLTRQSPRIVCLRVASCSNNVVSNQDSHESPRVTHRSQTCIYALPERPGKAPPTPRRMSIFNQNHEAFLDEYRTLKKTQAVTLESRRLLALQKGEDRHRLLKPSARRLKPSWVRLIPSVVWEMSPYPTPPAVEFFKHAKRPEMQPDKVNSVCTATLAKVGRNTTKQSIRLPHIGPQLQQHDTCKNSLLCCLLPAQRLTLDFTSTSARPIAQMGRKNCKNEVLAGDVEDTASDRTT